MGGGGGVVCVCATVRFLHIWGFPSILSLFQVLSTWERGNLGRSWIQGAAGTRHQQGIYGAVISPAEWLQRSLGRVCVFPG